MPLLHNLLLICLLTAFGGCAVNSQKQLTESGQSPLTAEQLYALAAGHTLHLTSADFDGRVYFLEDGTFAAQNRGKRKDTGEWDITTDDMLCLAFETWFFGDLKCYAVFPDGNTGGYIFFTANGARHYTARKLQGDPNRLAAAQKEKPTSYLQQKKASLSTDHSVTPKASANRKEYTPAPAPPPSKAEMKHHLVKMAQNCPDCNLAGADLSRANLIGANLAGADLSGADLSRANLRRANLAGANLSGANLRTTNLPGANLANCNLQNADFSGANLVKADLTGALTRGTLFKGSHLEGTKGLK